ncbi:LPS assembly lipoprotein LptE [Leadbetterella byssophila]|jgi:hypothetical protein|uniref:Lipopolysaccharide-assembly n=1 Tax=Leadbetterella byssophila (strain DSM 17132 / JCM 16389 / KACC 11308 / NBRC 106382 / 4M15) TaxID=649349 RepID=E4RTL2_LEAB4|nr:LPS assembly lipoprotein LptE [Leadbetterella byssophila]ADQ16869.1 hypothetical protein Lbys_1147 [Leadbetterella byssophila DSM 17132]
MKSLRLIFCALWTAAFVSGCGAYSFTGKSTLSSDVKTFTIRDITLSAPSSYATISQEMTEKLKEYYQRNTKLKLVPQNGDISIEGSIVDYRTDGVAASSGGDKAAMNRLTIVIEVVFTNKFNEEDNFEKDFSFYLDYPQNQTLQEAEKTLVPKILDQLVLNIFGDTVAKW